MTDASTYLFATLYFWMVSKDWYNFAMIGYMLNLLTAVGAFLLPESPRFLLEKGRIDELEETMQMIANFNRKQLRFNPSLFRTKAVESGSIITTNDEESPQKADAIEQEVSED